MRRERNENDQTIFLCFFNGPPGCRAGGRRRPRFRWRGAFGLRARFVYRVRFRPQTRLCGAARLLRSPASCNVPLLSLLCSSAGSPGSLRLFESGKCTACQCFTDGGVKMPGMEDDRSALGEPVGCPFWKVASDSCGEMGLGRGPLQQLTPGQRK
jgi:hypothetical protein